MHLENEFLWWLKALLVFPVVMLLLVELVHVQRRRRFSRLRPGVMILLMLALLLLLVLSGCGTAPLQVLTSPSIPAGLLTPPRPPVLLKPASPSTMPGTTTPATPRPALTTGWPTSA